MPNVEFRIDGLTRGRVRLNRRTRRLRDYPPAVFAVAALVAVVALSDRSPSVAINGAEVRGSRVLVLVDISGSMPGDGVQVRTHLGAMAAAGISVELQDQVYGSAIGYRAWGLLSEFDKGIASHPDIDTLYVISDFEDAEFNEIAGIDRFIATIRARDIRVYWATVNNDPLPIYHDIARASGGGVIPPR